VESSARPRILLVEDDPTIREMTQLALQRDGFAVDTAGDAATGLSAFRSQAPDEQQSSARSAPMDPGQSGRARVAAQSSNPPMPRPAAGALPDPNPNAVQKTFRPQNPSEQQSSSTAAPAELGQSGRTRQPN